MINPSKKVKPILYVSPNNIQNIPGVVIKNPKCHCPKCMSINTYSC